MWMWGFSGVSIVRYQSETLMKLKMWKRQVSQMSAILRNGREGAWLAGNKMGWVWPVSVKWPSVKQEGRWPEAGPYGSKAEVEVCTAADYLLRLSLEIIWLLVCNKEIDQVVALYCSLLLLTSFQCCGQHCSIIFNYSKSKSVHCLYAYRCW